MPIKNSIEVLLPKVRQQVSSAAAFLSFFVKRCVNDRINVIAGHLTYVSLLSLVPLLAVVFAMFAAFPMFGELRESVQAALLENLIPTSSDAIEGYLERFVGNANQMTAVGAVFLFVVAIMLMSAIDKTMNTIWRVNKRRRLSISLAVYWMILTMGPVLVGISIAMSSYLFALASFTDGYISGLQTTVLRLVPYLSTFVAFLLLYIMVPNRVVRFRHAVWGAALAAVLFESAKNAFQYYLKAFPSYELIYGALAAIPIMIVWIYFSWNIILLGAELAASIEEYTNEPKEPAPEEELHPEDIETK
ncbi:virulence factor BrkB family protein [Aliidiomarina celeris]|uniref:virulence factor BrkB family protein n=1 Tax=Aliidiomarina celeris TaxID=2249428 RepID=UPI000DEBFDDE|nr:virulence factor BrkB family protein [Aliidiomarina celeris]